MTSWRRANRAETGSLQLFVALVRRGGHDEAAYIRLAVAAGGRRASCDCCTTGGQLACCCCSGLGSCVHSLCTWRCARVRFDVMCTDGVHDRCCAGHLCICQHRTALLYGFRVCVAVWHGGGRWRDRMRARLMRGGGGSSDVSRRASLLKTLIMLLLWSLLSIS